MIIRVLSSLLIGLLLSVPAVGQDSKQSRLFTGLSIAGIDVGGDRNGTAGLQGSYTRPLSDNVGFTADVGGQFGTLTFVNFQSYQFLFGPQISGRAGRIRGFAHALGGIAHVRSGGGTFDFFGIPITIPATSNTGVALGFGGGLDVGLGKRVSLRLFQVDAIPARLAGQWGHSVRVGFGLVFKFGGS